MAQRVLVPVLQPVSSTQSTQRWFGLSQLPRTGSTQSSFTMHCTQARVMGSQAGMAFWQSALVRQSTQVNVLVAHVPRTGSGQPLLSIQSTQLNVCLSQLPFSRFGSPA